MRKYFILSLLFLLAVGLSAPFAVAQSTGSVKGVCKDFDGKPIAQAEVEWYGTENGRKYTLKTNAKGEYFSLGIAPGKYNVTLRKDGKELDRANGVTVEMDETQTDFDLKKEAESSGKSPATNAEQAKRAEVLAKAKKEKETVGALNEKLNAAKTASDAGDFETAIATLNDANQFDNTRSLIWFKLGDAYRMSGPKQTDPAEKQKRYEIAATDYQKAIDLRTASEVEQKESDNNTKLAGYYNNLADVYGKSNKVDAAVASYNKAIAIDPAGTAAYLFNIGAVLTNAGRADDAIVAFDKVIAADPTKAAAYYWKGVNLIAKETTDKDNKVIAPPGTAEAFQKYLELQPNGSYAEAAKGMLASIGATLETGYGKKKPVKK